MTGTGALGGALLMLAQASGAPSPMPAPALAAPTVFAPPLGQPMTYRVTARRRARDGTMASYTIVYALQWDRAGRGIRLVATLRAIESDAKPELAQALGKLLAPLVGEPITYLVASDGSRIDIADPDDLWQRVLARTVDNSAQAPQPEAKQAAGLLAALPAAERERLATADIRALVAPANDAIPAAPGAGVSVAQDGGVRTVSRVEEDSLAGGAQPVEIDMSWAIDTATGLVISERRQSWIGGGKDGARTLVEERIRALAPAVADEGIILPVRKAAP